MEHFQIPKAVHFSVPVDNRQHTAHVRLQARRLHGLTVEFSLRKTAQGWRIEDSDAVPSGY
jgi:hypothetical protein